MDRLCQENQQIINRVIDNQVGMSSLLFFMKNKETSKSYKQTKEVVEEFSKNKFVRDVFLKDIVVENNAIGRLMDLGYIWKDTEYYKEKYAEMIDVGEFENPEQNKWDDKGYEFVEQISQPKVSNTNIKNLVFDKK